MNASARALALLSGLLLTTGCQIDSRQQVLATDKSALELRAMSTRVFDTSSKNLTVRNVIATLQDLGFVVTKWMKRSGR